jgi:hypothetical protein
MFPLAFVHCSTPWKPLLLNDRCFGYWENAPINPHPGGVAYPPAADPEGSLKIATVSPYGYVSWKLPPAATATYCTPFT